jgi:hypothetical protein
VEAPYERSPPVKANIQYIRDTLSESGAPASALAALAAIEEVLDTKLEEITKIIDTHVAESPDIFNEEAAVIVARLVQAKEREILVQDLQQMKAAAPPNSKVSAHALLDLVITWIETRPKL